MKCRICGFEISEKENSHQCCHCCSKNCSKGKCPNCGHQNLSEIEEMNFKQLSVLKKHFKRLKIRIIK